MEPVPDEGDWTMSIATQREIMQPELEVSIVSSAESAEIDMTPSV